MTCMVPNRRVAFLCLGVMGGPIAGHLARAGHTVSVFNRTVSRAEDWAQVHAELDVSVAVTPAEAVRNAEIVFACTGADSDFYEVRSIRACSLSAALSRSGRPFSGSGSLITP